MFHAAATSWPATERLGTWFGSNRSPRVITHHKMRAFVLAKATLAYCHPMRSLSCTSHRLMGSLRLWAVITADLGTLDQQGAQINIATFGDTTELGLAA